MEIQNYVMLDPSLVDLMILIVIQKAQLVWLKQFVETQDTLNAVVLVLSSHVAFQVLHLA